MEVALPSALKARSFTLTALTLRFYEFFNYFGPTPVFEFEAYTLEL